jgi:hypothetical protein
MRRPKPPIKGGSAPEEDEKVLWGLPASQGLLGPYSIPESYRLWYAFNDISVAINEKYAGTRFRCVPTKKKTWLWKGSLSFSGIG